MEIKDSKLPNKLSFTRIILTIVILIFLLVPMGKLGDEIAIYKNVFIRLDYVIAGILFIVASITDYFDGKIARKYNYITDLGKMLDAIADKVLVNTVLIAFVSVNMLPAFVAIIIVFRDIIVDALKMQAGNKGHVVAAIKTGKIKTFSMMTGLTLKFFSNLPFALWNLEVADVLIYFAVVRSIISCFEYINYCKEYF